MDHAGALDGLFTATTASLVNKRLVKVRRISQDGVRVRAGAGSFRRGATLDQLLADAERHVEDLARQVADPEFAAAAVGSSKAAAAKRAAAQMPELRRKQAEAAKRAGVNGKRGQEIAAEEPRFSTIDADARAS